MRRDVLSQRHRETGEHVWESYRLRVVIIKSIFCTKLSIWVKGRRLETKSFSLGDVEIMKTRKTWTAFGRWTLKSIRGSMETLHVGCIRPHQAANVYCNNDILCYLYILMMNDCKSYMKTLLNEINLWLHRDVYCFHMTINYFLSI